MQSISCEETTVLLNKFMGIVVKNSKILESIIEIQPIRSTRKYSSRSIVSRVNTDKYEYYVKLYPDDSRYVKKEILALHKLNNRLVFSVPEIVEYNIKDLPAYLILKKICGESFDNLSEAKVLSKLNEVIKIISHFRNIKFKTYGEIIGTYDPAPNKSDLNIYTMRLMEFWINNIANYVNLSEFPKLNNLMNADWAFESNLSLSPCLCHSDLKLSDIILTTKGPIIIDFDNAFSYVPEFDLCKLFLSIRINGIQLSLKKYADIISSIYNVDVEKVKESMHQFFFIAALRLLNYQAINDEPDIFCSIYKILASYYDELETL